MLHAVIERLPAPGGDPEAETKALIFDSTYDDYRGVVVYFRVMDGRCPSGTHPDDGDGRELPGQRDRQVPSAPHAGPDGRGREVGFSAPAFVASPPCTSATRSR